MTDRTPAQALAASIRAGWNLGNTLDAMKRGAVPGTYVPPREAETAWHNPPATRSLIRAVRDAGFDAVRVCHAAYFTAAARARGICCFWWDCGAFALFDRFAEKPLQPDIIRALV